MPCVAYTAWYPPTLSSTTPKVLPRTRLPPPDLLCLYTQTRNLGALHVGMSRSSVGSFISPASGFGARVSSCCSSRVGSGARAIVVLRVRCFRWDSASIAERCCCVGIPSGFHSCDYDGNTCEFARSGRKALVTKFVGPASYLRRTTPRAAGWVFCSQILTDIGSISYTRYNTPIALEERPRPHVA